MYIQEEKNTRINEFDIDFRKQMKVFSLFVNWVKKTVAILLLIQNLTFKTLSVRRDLILLPFLIPLWVYMYLVIVVDSKKKKKKTKMFRNRFYYIVLSWNLQNNNLLGHLYLLVRPKPKILYHLNVPKDHVI